jgi:hypothetical protein
VRWALALAFCIAAAFATWGGVRDDEAGLRLIIHEAVPRPDVGDPNPLGRQLWSIWPRFSVEPTCAGARVAAGSRTLLNGRQVPGANFEGDGYSGYTVEISARATCPDGRHAEARRAFLLPPASCEGGPFRLYDVRGSVAVRDYSFVDEAEPVPLAEGHYVGTDSVVEVHAGGRVEIAAPECNRLRVIFGPGVYQVGSYERGGGNWFAGPEITAVGDRHGGRFFVEPEPDRPSPAHVMPLTERPSSYAVRRVRGRVVVRVYEGLVGVTGHEEEHVVKVGRLHQVSVLPRAARPTRPRLFQPNEPWGTAPAGISTAGPTVAFGEWPAPAELAPPFSQVEARRLPAAGGAPAQIVATWQRRLRGQRASRGGLLIWERSAASRWSVVYSRRFEFGGYQAVQVGDVSGDGHDDVLLETSLGTGGCGPRRLIAFAGGGTRELYGRYFCEGHADIVRGSLRVRRGIGPCPYIEDSAHCRGGLSTTFLRWEGQKLVRSRRDVKCDLPRLDPARDCAPRQG